MGDKEEWEAQLPTFVGGMRSEENAAVPAVAETSAARSTTGSPALDVKDALARALARTVAAGFVGGSVTARETVDTTITEGVGLDGVVGVGVATAAPDEGEDKAGAFSAEAEGEVLRVYLTEPMPEDRLRAILARQPGAEGAADTELPLEPVITGEIVALAHNFKLRPAPGGISIAHFAIAAGTLGCLARGRSGDRRDRLLILSNNHVLANENKGSFGDLVLQPARLDGGTSADRVAALERYKAIDFSGGVNYVDCATAWADPTLVRTELFYMRSGVPQYFRFGTGVASCAPGLRVAKTGRTTELTQGIVRVCNATVRVRFQTGVAIFQDQIEVTGSAGVFSAGGDSGSLIFTDDEQRRPVGLLFAGGGGSTFANKIDRVLTDLDIDLVPA